MRTKMQIICVPGQSPENGDTMRAEEESESPFRLESWSLDDDTKQLAKDELRETEERMQEATQELRLLLKDDDRLNFDDSDEFLRIFLRPTKYYPSSALELMRRVADFREKHAEVLKNLSAGSEMMSLLDNRVVNVLTNRDNKGRRVLLVNIGSKWDTKKLSSDQLFRLFYLVHLAALLEPETQVRGVVVILDFDGLAMSQVRAMDIGFSRRLLNFIQYAMPLRLKEVHIVRQPFLFSVVWTIFQSFVEKKLSNRLYKHGSRFDSLHKHIDPAFLPQDYGGTLPKINYSSREWYPVLASVDDSIKAWQNYGKVSY